MFHTAGPNVQNMSSRTVICLSPLLSSVPASFQAAPTRVVVETAAPGFHPTDPASPREGPRLSSSFPRRS